MHVFMIYNDLELRDLLLLSVCVSLVFSLDGTGRDAKRHNVVIIVIPYILTCNSTSPSAIRHV